MEKPRLFLGSSGKQAKLLDALTCGLEDVAHVQPWMTSFNPGTTTLERLLELAREVDFAAFVFAQDDWTTNTPTPQPAATPGQASPRDDVVFEAGLFGGVLGMRRTFILHASGAKLPTDLLGLTCVRYDGSTAASENEGRASRIEGIWWEFALTQRSEKEPRRGKAAGPRAGQWGGGAPLLRRGRLRRPPRRRVAAAGGGEAEAQGGCARPPESSADSVSATHESHSEVAPRRTTSGTEKGDRR